MSTHQQQHQILQTCQHINQLLSIPAEQFSLQSLAHIDWYLTVLELIYPQLSDRFQQIKRIDNQAKAIDKLLYMLTQEEIIQEDFLQIKGQDIVNGDIESFYYLVQLLSALIERQCQEQEQQDPQGEDQQAQQEQLQQQNEQQQDDQEPHHSSTSHPYQEEQYSNDFEQPLDSNNQSPQKPATLPSPPAQNLPKPTHSNQIFKNVFNHYDSQDEPSRQQERHSVLGIHNQFEDQQDEEEEVDDDENDIRQQLSSGGNKNGNNATFGQQQSQNPNHQQSLSKQTQQVSNAFPNQPQKPHKQLVSTGYKMTQQPKKQFPSSSSDQVNFYEQPSKNQYENQGKKVSKPSKPSKGSKQETEEEDDNEYFINPTIKKYKSDPKLLKTVGSASKKSTTKKNLGKFASPIAASKQSRKLVSHPTIKKQYRKAANPQAKKLTQQVMTQASVVLKKKKNGIQQSNMANPVGEEMQRKAKQLKVKLGEWKKDSKLQQKRKLKVSNNQAKSSIQLTKVLNWREGQLKREKQQFQKAMEMKLQVQKQSYIKKINSLLIKLQKQKQLHERQQYKQHLIKQNHQAAKRLTAIEHWYKDRIAMLKETNSENRNQRKLMHTGHKQILKHIETELKRDNQKQIMAITMKYRRQEAQVQNDLEELQREIVKVYKKH